MEKDALDKVKSSTIGVKAVLRPYWKSKALAKKLHTPEVIEAYKTYQETLET